MLIFGYIFAFLTGCLMPSIALVMGELIGSFDPREEKNINELMLDLFSKIMTIAALLWLMGYL
jgi:hypothetical protein